ncbi:beta-lactamase class A/beta-lactamase class A VEB [Aquimarina sp. EL_43]|nr:MULTISPECIES: class A beta-lactamase, subclass A2 [unclassified Aquimarina]MBG6129155.1 beta-lactamase class A/beta-lactamase class A VEB [Aquimarina sp. EL_35]MBG6150220.1 beta-lactamase class A/beta-lactamase class A VEB [Aquimarina sp. EL_32]MBG6167095.1 beta-lactamase class A/beta-lactamase class A VEB [Aquimarina sp. EL_43]
MVKKRPITFLIFLIIFTQGYSQKIETLKQKIEDIINSKNAVVGVAINGMETKDTLSINGQRHFPMQSVFKFPIALTILSEIDKGNLSLEQKIDIKKSELLPGLWSPIRKKYPEGGTLTVAEIIKYTVALSDNVGCDVLLKLLGKPQTVENYFSNLGFKDFSVKINEETMQNNWDLQFLNWTTPKEANKILETFYTNSNGLLSKESHEFVWSVMKGTKTGKNRLRGQLPKETIVAHKTGWSGAHKETGITAAVNNIGIVFLPNGKYFIISVFITESTENFETNEKMISDISKATWDYFINQ